MQFCGNDILVIQAFSDAGIPAEQIDPRHNVLTFNAWKAKDRSVAKGAISVRCTTWIPCKDSKSQTQTGEEAKSRLRPKAVFLFHESQTNSKGSPKGTAPAAANNPALIREGTYETVTEEKGPYREGMYEVNVKAFKDEDNLPRVCTCPAVGLVTNVDHGDSHFVEALAAMACDHVERRQCDLEIDTCIGRCRLAGVAWTRRLLKDAVVGPLNFGDGDPVARGAKPPDSVVTLAVRMGGDDAVLDAAARP